MPLVCHAVVVVCVHRICCQLAQYHVCVCVCVLSVYIESAVSWRSTTCVCVCVAVCVHRICCQLAQYHVCVCVLLSVYIESAVSWRSTTCVCVCCCCVHRICCQLAQYHVQLHYFDIAIQHYKEALTHTENDFQVMTTVQH